MLAIIFSFLFLVIGLGGLWFHDVQFPPEGRAGRKKWNRSGVIEDTAAQSKEQLVAVHMTNEVATTIHAEAKGQN